MMRIIRKEYAGTVKAPNLRAVSRALDVVCGTLPQLNEPPHRRLDLGLETLRTGSVWSRRRGRRHQR
jgi:hypothetical protein